MATNDFPNNSWPGLPNDDTCPVNTRARTLHNHDLCIMSWNPDEITDPKDKAINANLNSIMGGTANNPLNKLLNQENIPETLNEFINAVKESFGNVATNGGATNSTDKTDSNSGKVKVHVNGQDEEAPSKTEVEDDSTHVTVNAPEVGEESVENDEEFTAHAMHDLAVKNTPKISHHTMEAIKSLASMGKTNYMFMSTSYNDVMREADALRNCGFMVTVNEVQLSYSNSRTWEAQVSW